MKVTIKENAKQAEIKYPCLMVSDKRTIVLFASLKNGTVLKSDIYDVGVCGDDWAMCLFTQFTGTVELSND